VTAHIIQKRLSFKVHESIYVWRGEIGGEEGTDEKGNTVGWFSYEGEWML
jgi:hypothetical protein